MTNSVHRPARIVALLTLVVLVVVLLLARGVGATTGDSPESAGAHVVHRVIGGETLWGIAAEYAAPGDDLRKAVFTIQQANDLNDSVIHPGQELLIPAG